MTMFNPESIHLAPLVQALDIIFVLSASLSGACTLIPLSIAYSGILERGRQPHLILEKRRKELRGRLEALQSLIEYGTVDTLSAVASVSLFLSPNDTVSICAFLTAVALGVTAARSSRGATAFWRKR